MDLELIEKIDDLIKTLDNSLEFKKILDLKKKIYENKDLKIKLMEFNKIKDNVYDQKYVSLKKDILTIPEVKEYKHLENELYLLVMAINNKLKLLTESDLRCSKWKLLVER